MRIGGFVVHVSKRSCSLNPFRWLSPWPQTHTFINTLLNTRVSFSAALLSGTFPCNLLASLFFLDSALSPQLCLWNSTYFPRCTSIAWNSLKAMIQDSSEAHLACFPHIESFFIIASHPPMSSY